MSLTQEQIEKLSKNLSKIRLNDEKLANDINEILQYIDLLNEVDTT
jgi:Asp-tRNA(Asn)/Glu-tRNA(Gln) amidotransferase C subunit